MMTTIVVYLDSPADEKRSFGEPRPSGQLCFRWSRARRYRRLFFFKLAELLEIKLRNRK
jgi:hypothetical protein